MRVGKLAIAVLDAGSPSMRHMAARMRLLGVHVLPCKTPDHAERLLATRGQGVGAAVIPVDLPAFDLSAALRFLRKLEPTGELTFVAAGRRPEREVRTLLRGAGVELALWEPVDDHTLRFQSNRALATSDIVRGSRSALRAPTDWPIAVFAGARRKPARVYSLSASGAYLATPRPSLPGADVEIELPIGGGARVPARVVMTNVPGHFLRENLPLGMGISFETFSPAFRDTLARWARERLEAMGF